MITKMCAIISTNVPKIWIILLKDEMMIDG